MIWSGCILFTRRVVLRHVGLSLLISLLDCRLGGVHRRVERGRTRHFRMRRRVRRNGNVLSRSKYSICAIRGHHGTWDGRTLYGAQQTSRNPTTSSNPFSVQTKRTILYPMTTPRAFPTTIIRWHWSSLVGISDFLVAKN